MPHLQPSEIVEEVKQVLLGALKVKGSKPGFLTAFQILERLPAATRDRLVAERTLSGADAAPNVVANVAATLPGIIMDFIDCRGITVSIGNGAESLGDGICGLYRLVAKKSGWTA